MIVSPITVEMSADEFYEFKQMQKRNEAKPVRKSEWEHEGKTYVSLYCPTCDASVNESNLFCKACGQKLDTENTAL